MCVRVFLIFKEVPTTYFFILLKNSELNWCNVSATLWMLPKISEDILTVPECCQRQNCCFISLGLSISNKLLYYIYFLFTSNSRESLRQVCQSLCLNNSARMPWELWTCAQFNWLSLPDPLPIVIVMLSVASGSRVYFQSWIKGPVC